MTPALVVDDDARNRYLLRVVLAARGIAVTEANDGAEALERARASPPDIVISDLLMPVMDGFRLLAQWKADPALSAIPFLVYTATYTDARDERLVRELGADGFLLKPAEPDRLMAAVDAALERAARRRTDRTPAVPAPAEKAPSEAERTGEAGAMPGSATSLYHEALVAKLESKTRELEASNRRLAESERHYRNLFDANPHPMWVFDVETLRFLAVNDAAVHHYGWSRDEFLAMTIEEIRPREDVDRLRTRVVTVAPDAFLEAGLWRHVKRDGTAIDVEIRSHGIDFFGHRARIVLANDLTARVRAERERRESERLLRQVLDTLHVGVWQVDAGGRIVAANPAGRRIWAGERKVGIEDYGEYRGWWASDGRPIAAHEWAAARAIEKGETSLDEVVDIQCFDGSRKTILNSAVPLRDDAGALRGAIIVNHDITALKEAERALDAAERRHRATFEQAAVGMANVSLGGRWLDVNRRLCDILGRTREQVLATTPESVTHAEDRRADTITMALLAGGEIPSYAREKRCLRPDGSIVRVRTTASLVRGPGGAPDYIVEAIEDVSARHRAEEALRRISQQLVDVRERESARIAREIHDELGGALTGFKLDLAWIGRRLDESGADAAQDPVRERIRTMREALDATVATTRRICTELRPAVLDDLGLAAAIEWQAREFGRRSQVEVDLALDEHMPAVDDTVSTTVFRIVQEVLTNVARHAQARRVRIALAPAGGSLALEIADDGRGLDVDAAARGGGLGLAGIRERVALCGGTLAIDSVARRGTTVRVAVPLTATAPEPDR